MDTSEKTNCSLEFFNRFPVQLNNFTPVKKATVRYYYDEMKIAISISDRCPGIVEQALIIFACKSGFKRVADSDFSSPGSYEFLASDHMILAIVTSVPQTAGKVKILLKKYPILN